ncbi:phosphatase PAP2 family protein [Vibrio sp. PP-XX7]
MGILFASTVNASNSDDWSTISSIGTDSLVVAALGLPVLEGDIGGFSDAGLSILGASAMAGVGKYLIDAERPDQSDDNSFPSNHTANAFAAATNLHLRYGWTVGLPAYGVATLVGIGRAQANKHHWSDVVAGATVGTLSGWYFTTEHFQLLPWASRNGLGFNISTSW